MNLIHCFIPFEENNGSFNDEQLVLVCLDLFEAGSETTSTTILWSVLYMALHPKIQKKCQTEVDEKIGARPPTIEVQYLREISYGTPTCTYK